MAKGKRVKKRIGTLALVVLAIILAASPVLAAGSLRVGPLEVVDPIVWGLAPASPPLPAPGTKMEPGDSFSVMETISNTSVKRGYWTQINISWSTEDGNVLVEITTKAAGQTLRGPLYIPAGTSKIVEITVRIRENSPPAKGLIFYFDPPSRVEPERG